MRRIASTLTAGTVLPLCLCATGSAVMAHSFGGAGDGAPTSGRPGPTGLFSRAELPHGVVPLAKPIRTPRQCFHACLRLAGASIDFCAVSCY
jgi:hypothetical protein